MITTADTYCRDFPSQADIPYNISLRVCARATDLKIGVLKFLTLALKGK